MKVLLPLWGACLIVAGTLRAQPVSIGLITERDQYIPGEKLLLKVAITNLSGRTLTFSTHNAWLQLTVTDMQNLPVPKIGEVKIPVDFSVGNGEVAKPELDLSSCFDMIAPGRYSINATVQIQELNQARSPSVPKRLEITKGTVLWEQEFGYSKEGETAPEVRKYTLQQAHNAQHQLRLYVRVSDPDATRIFKIFPISPLYSFSQPQAQIDRKNCLHVLNQSGPRSFDYFVIGPDGEILRREFHEILEAPIPTRPRLGVGPAGQVQVLDGQRRFSPNDVPSAKGITLAAPASVSDQRLSR